MNNYDLLRTIFEPYRTLDTLSRLAALQLFPQNATRALRLEVAAVGAAQIPDDPARAGISKGRLLNILHSEPLGGHIANLEDMCDYPFIDLMHFFGGSFRIYTGVTDALAHTASALIRALLRPDSKVLSDKAKAAGSQVTQAALVLSDAIAGAMQHHRYTPPEPGDGFVYYPSSTEIEVARAAVTFSQDRIQRLFAKWRIPDYTLQVLAADAGSYRFPSDSPSPAALLRRPLTWCGDVLVAAIPAGLLVSVRAFLVYLVAQEGKLGQLATELKHVYWGRADETLQTVARAMPVPLELPVQRIAPVCLEGVYQIDADKAAVVVVIVDPLDDIDHSDAYLGRSRIEISGDVFREHLASIRELWREHRAVREILFIVVFEGIGRGWGMSFDPPQDDDIHVLCGSSEDIKIIAESELPEPFGIYHFAKQCTKLHRSAKVVAFSILDIYQAYRSHRKTLNLTDDERPDYISFGVGSALELRQEWLHERDEHSVLYHDDAAFIRVMSRWRDSPVYATSPPELELVVEGFPVPIWVTLDSGASHDVEAVGEEALAESVAYWLWQVQASPHSNELLRGTVKPVLIRVRMGGPVDASTEPIHAECFASENGIILTLLPQLADQARYPQNEADRCLLRTTLKTLARLSAAPIDEASIERMVEDAAPLGEKKMLHMMSSGAVARYDSRGLPAYHPVSEAAYAQVEREISDFSFGERIAQVGPVPAETVLPLLHSIVGYAYKRVTGILAGSNPLLLRRRLMVTLESTLFERDHQKMHLRSRIACFSTVEKVVSELQKQIPELATSTACLRFMLELVSATPPSGQKIHSEVEFEGLLAWSDAILHYGQLADVVNLGLGTVELEIMKSERLSVGRTRYDTAMAALLKTHASAEVFRSIERDSLAGSRESELERAIDDATLEAWGFTLADAQSFLIDALAVAMDRQRQFIDDLELDWLNEMTRRLGWPRAKIEAIFDWLVLRPRADYLSPPPGLEKSDIWPWRHGRELSLLRRPFIAAIEQDGHHVVYGLRCVGDAYTYIGSKFHNAGFKAPKAGKLSKLNGYLVKLKGAEFNDAVTAHFRSSGFITEGNVKKFGALRFPDGSDLDLIAIDQRLRNIFAIECKNLRMAITPYDLASEVAEMYGRKAGDRCYVSRHGARLAWLQENIEHVLDKYGLERKSQWNLLGLIIVNRELASPHFQAPPITVLPWAEIQQFKPDELSEHLRSRIRAHQKQYRKTRAK